MTDKFIDEETKYKRLERLNEKNREACLKSNERFVGKVLKVLVEGKTEKDGKITLNSRADNNKIVHFEDNTKNIGDFVNVKLYSNNKVKVPVVKMVAVQENQAGKFVYKLDENNIPKLVYIKTSGQTGDCWIVSEGVVKGDRIVTDGIQKVIPGQPITIVSPDEMQKIKKNEMTDEDKE